MKQVKVALIGAGQRGRNSYSPYALQYPNQMQVVAVAERNEGVRERFAEQYGIPEEGCFPSGEALLASSPACDAVLICTQDSDHYALAVDALERGYHLLLEKPMATTPQECVQLGRLAEEKGVVFAICHVLRYTPFFETIKALLDEGRIGRLIDIQYNENVGYFHYAHSYVRGNWRRADEASPMILSKSCHDMDILLWLAGDKCKSIASYGSLSYFTEANTPTDAPMRCTDGCPAEAQCPYSAMRFYLSDARGTGFVRAVTEGATPAGILHALRTGPYGRCVFHCDNDVVDHQVSILSFEGDVNATFNLSAFTGEISRTLKLMGTTGEIRGDLEKAEIEVTCFINDQKDRIRLAQYDIASGHNGGDFGLMRNFINAVATGDTGAMRTSAWPSTHAHLMCFAAEESRRTGQSVNMEQYEASFQ